MNYFLNNREIIKKIAINVGTTTNPQFVPMCTTSEVELTTDFNTSNFYVYCDAIERSIITGAAVSFDTTVKLDIDNEAIQALLTRVHTLISTGSIAQFNNQEIQFELLSGVTNGVLAYTTYTAKANLVFGDLGGAAEDEGEFSLEVHLNGPATVIQ